ncbi:MAG: bifunctional phosphoribosyl-AMP cyclohydrolase/phosphoribosyl-ATP diphosphatase HisIE [Trueperaceae bacterium]
MNDSTHDTPVGAGDATDDANASAVARLLDGIAYDERGLVTVVTQDANDGTVLMVAYANREALERTLATRKGHYFSRSRGEPWRKGATSGHVQHVIEVRYDCDADAVLYRVEQTGPACHTGARSCFYRSVPGFDEERATGDIDAVMTLLERVVNERLRTMPEGSYVRRLHERGLGYVAQKVIEEAGESVVAALQSQDDELIGESADLLFHLTVLLRERGVSWRDVAERLLERHAGGER